jgi:hypothetical protein
LGSLPCRVDAGGKLRGSLTLTTDNGAHFPSAGFAELRTEVLRV